MSNEWNDIVKEVSPHEEAEANKKLKETAEKERYLEKEILLGKEDNVENRVWNYELRMLNKLLGWEMMGKVSHGTRHATGKEELVRTSEKTFEVREKVNYSFKDYEKMRLDKTKISDLQEFDKLDKEAAEFLTQAKEKFGKVFPVMFGYKDYVRYFVDGIVHANGKSSLIITGVVLVVLAFLLGKLVPYGYTVLPILALIIAGNTALSVSLYRKKNASYLPMVEAYHNKVKEFEERAKKLALS